MHLYSVEHTNDQSKEYNDTKGLNGTDNVKTHATSISFSLFIILLIDNDSIFEEKGRSKSSVGSYYSNNYSTSHLK